MLVDRFKKSNQPALDPIDGLLNQQLQQAKTPPTLRQRARIPLTPPVQMELIRPGKRKVRVTTNVVKNTP